MPDISYFGNEKANQILLETIHYPAPDFVVEVLASTSDIIDKEIKLNDYEKHGVKEYWIVSPEDHDVFHVLTRTGLTVKNEIELQFYLLGNGKRSLFLFIVIGSSNFYTFLRPCHLIAIKNLTTYN